jgi:hypothetical protein
MTTCETLRTNLAGTASVATLRSGAQVVAPPPRAKRAYLPRRGTLVLDNRQGTVIVVESGCLWVTLERDPRDVILVKGMRFEIDRIGRTVIVAEEDSRFRLLASATRLERAGAWVARLAAHARARWRAGMARRGVPYY